jgi:hypothetical protein
LFSEVMDLAGLFASVANLIVKREPTCAGLPNPKSPAGRPLLESAVGKGRPVNQGARKQQQGESFQRKCSRRPVKSVPARAKW